ncbi:MAG: amino acid ABC transporter permease [Desulfuromonadaceae bacterium]
MSHALFDPATVFVYLPRLLSKLPVTLLIVAVATLFGLVAGMGLALIRLFKVPILNQAAIVYISFMRGTPIIVQMFLVFYGVPMLLELIGIDINRWDKLFFVVLTYGLNTAAFKAEAFRAALRSVPAGQAEAAYAVGLTRWQCFRRIIIPQALLIALPSLGTGLASLLQDTSLAYTLGVIDVMGQVQAIASGTNRMLEGYVGAAIIFLVMAVAIEKGFGKLEANLLLKRHH